MRAQLVDTLDSIEEGGQRRTVLPRLRLCEHEADVC
jgi:hypothetical protein